MTDQRVAAAVRSLADALPVADPPPFRETAVRRDTPRPQRWLPALAAAAAVVAVVAAVALVPVSPGGPPVPPAAGGATLPDRFADWSPLTADVTRAPAGRAVALVGTYSRFSDDVWNQLLVVGADRDTYRRVDVASGTSPLLSADGSALAQCACTERADNTVDVLDLTTGKSRRYPLPAGSVARLLTWSPDGRFVAYAFAPHGGSVFDNLRRLEHGSQLGVLDLTTGSNTTLEGQASGVGLAAFSPDGLRLAVSIGRQRTVIHPFPDSDAPVIVRDNFVPAGPGAWSPDGTRLVGYWTGFVFSRGPSLVALPATGGGPVTSVPGSNSGSFLGWTSDETILLQGQGQATGEVPIYSVALDTGQRRPVTVMHAESTLAAVAWGLLPGIGVRPAGTPDRGPWPPWFVVLVVAVALVIVTPPAAALWWWRRARVGRRAT